MTANNCGKFAAMIATSTAVMSNIRRSLFIHFASNLTGIPIAAGVSYSIFALLFIAETGERGDDFQFDFGYLKCFTASKCEVVINFSNWACNL